MKTKRILIFILMMTGLMAVAWAEDASGPIETKTCFECNGTGEIKCRQTGCRQGRVDCPGPCVKLSGKWEKRNIAGHGPNELWQLVKFSPRGQGYVSQDHVGQYFTMEDHKVTLHTCETCKGAGTVDCSVCHGKGVAVCPICSGKKEVPTSWSAFDNPKMKERPTHFKLKDGHEIVGRKVMVVGSTMTIRTQKGDVKIETTDVLAEEKPTPLK